MYAKVFAQMYDGTLCTRGPWESLVTFQQLLVLADQEGNVDMTPEAISRRTTIPLQIIKKGLEELEKPDAESRTPTEEGRRIIPLSEGRAWGWKIVNYVFYRSLKREEDRREYHRNYWNENRSPSAKKSTLKKLNKAQQPQPNQPIAEAYANEVKNKKRAHAIPSDFGISDNVRKWAQAGGHLLLEKRLEHFRNWAISNGKLYVDWDATFRNAILGDYAKLCGPRTNGAAASPYPPEQPFEQDWEAIKEAAGLK